MTTAQILIKTLLALIIIGLTAYLYTTMPVPNPFAENKTDAVFRWSFLLAFLAVLVLALLAPFRKQPDKGRPHEGHVH